MRQGNKFGMQIAALTPGQKAWLPYIALIAAVFAVYANVYQNSFIMDDWNLIVYNDSLQHWSGFFDILTKKTLGPYYRPVQTLLYFFIYQAFGLSLPAFHALNVVIQAADACLIYKLGCRLGFYARAAFAAALLWGIHPLWVEAVAVVAGTSDLLVALFFMAGLLSLLPAFAPRRFWLAGLFFILALCSKESAVVFPALATFTLFLVSKQRLKPATYIRTWPLWLLAAVYIIGLSLCPVLINDLSHYMYQDSFYTEFYKHNIINRALTSLATLPVYFSLMFTLAHLHFDWEFPVITTVWNWRVIGGMAIAASGLFQIVRGRGKQGLPLTWGLLWFAAALSPYTGILKPIDGQLYEHWIYMPAIGLFMGVSQATAVWVQSLRSKKARVLATGLVMLAAVIFGIKTHFQNEVWHDAGSLYEEIIKDNPSQSAHYNLGVYYFGQKEYEEAAEQWRDVEAYYNYRTGLNKGGALFMHNSLAYIYLNVLSDKGTISMQDILHALPSSTHIPEVIAELKEAQAADPHVCCASQFLSGIYYYQGDKVLGDYYKELTEKNAPTNEIKNPGEPVQ